MPTFPTEEGSQPPFAVVPFDAAAAKRHQKSWAALLQLPVVKDNSIGMKLALIPAGEFQMGSAKSAEEEAMTFQVGAELFADERPQRLVRITEPFYLGLHQVTQGQWEQAMGTPLWPDADFDYYEEGPDYPTTYVGWDDALRFCRRLSEHEGITYRLPTEAEWEYACRAGTNTRYSFGDDDLSLGRYAWYRDNLVDGHPHRVGQKKPNRWGLYDMHGNVWEWCVLQDPSSDLDTVLRGGSCFNSACFCRSACRSTYRDSTDDCEVGFRVVAIPSCK